LAGAVCSWHVERSTKKVKGDRRFNALEILGSF